MYRCEPPYIPLPPSFAHFVDEEPDRVELDGSVDYDAHSGRMGSVCHLRLVGSDDGTTVEAVLRSEVLLAVNAGKLMPTGASTSIRVTLVLQCNESWVRGHTVDETGVSDFTMNLSSRFYLRFPESWDAARRSYFEAAVDVADRAEEALAIVFMIESDGGIEKNIDQQLAPENSSRTFSIEVDPPRGLKAEIPVVVGLEDKARLYTNDVGYDITYASSWTLDAVEFVPI